jgi:hypothetical protein
MKTATAIYGLERIGKDGAYEATGEVHWYCCEDHAGRHAIAEGFRTSSNYSKPTANSDALEGTVCEWCGGVL